MGYPHVEWRVLGSAKAIPEGMFGAIDVKPVQGAIFISGRVGHFKVYYLDTGFGPWKLSERRMMGTSNPIEEWEPVDGFRSMREAVREAKRLVRQRDGT